MHDTLLIKTKPTDATGLRDIFFQIGNMEACRDMLMDLLNCPQSPYAGNCLFRYNGIRLKIETKDIPGVIARLVNAGVELYGVYEPYF